MCTSDTTGTYYSSQLDASCMSCHWTVVWLLLDDLLIALFVCDLDLGTFKHSYILN